MKIKNIAKITLLLCLVSVNSYAAKLETLFGDWHVLTTMQDEKKVCYIASIPKDKQGNYKKRGESFLLVSLFDDRKAEVSVSAGYEYKSGSNVELNIDDKKYQLRELKGERAWSKTEDLDNKIISSMKAGNTLKAKGTSSVGTYSIDSYSLQGFSKAFAKMNLLCKKEPAVKTSKKQ